MEKVNEAWKKYVSKHVFYFEGGITLLNNLKKDILLVQSVEADDWNHTILKEVLRLIYFLYSIFNDLPGQSMLSSGVNDVFKKATNGGENEFSSLMSKLRSKKNKEVDELINDVLMKESEKISAKPVRELYILNELSRRVLNGRLMLIDKQAVQQKVKEIGKVVQEPAALFKTNVFY